MYFTSSSSWTTKQVTINGGNVNTSVTFTKNEVPEVKGRVTVQNSYNCGSGNTSVSITIKNYASSGERAGMIILEMSMLASIFKKKLVAMVVATIFLTAVIDGDVFNILL